MDEMKKIGVEVLFFAAARGDRYNVETLLDPSLALDAVVWWAWGCASVDFMKALRRARPDLKSVMYNWDDPHCRITAEHWESGRFTEDIYDYVLASAGENAHLGRYAFPFGTLHPPVLISRCPCPVRGGAAAERQFEYDIYFACTNLYDGTKDVQTTINRSTVVRMLSERYGSRFGFFGPEKITKFAPASYRRSLTYAETLVEPRKAKVCININGADGEGYMNERICTLLAAGSLIVSNGDVPFTVRAQTEEEFVAAVHKCVFEFNSDWAWDMRSGARDYARRNLDSSVWAKRIVDVCEGLCE